MLACPYLTLPCPLMWTIFMMASLMPLMRSMTGLAAHENVNYPRAIHEAVALGAA